jgi:hypothetical protein
LAANELAQLKGEDPLPLRKAKITQEAAVRRVQKAQKEVAEQKEATEAKKAEQEEAQKQLEAAHAQLEEAEAELQEKMAEAQAELQKAKDAGGVAQGNFWWMERQLYEAVRLERMMHFLLPPSLYFFSFFSSSNLVQCDFSLCVCVSLISPKIG